MKRFINDVSSSINPLSVGRPLNKSGVAARIRWLSGTRKREGVTRSPYRCSRLSTTGLDKFKRLPEYLDSRKSL